MQLIVHGCWCQIHRFVKRTDKLGHYTLLNVVWKVNNSSLNSIVWKRNFANFLFDFITERNFWPFLACWQDHWFSRLMWLWFKCNNFCDLIWSWLNSFVTQSLLSEIFTLPWISLPQSLKINDRFSLKVRMIGNAVSFQLTWYHCFNGQLLTANNT